MCKNVKIKIKIKRLNKNIPLPIYKHDGDAGMDVYANDDYLIKPGQTILVNTGLFFAIPKGYEIQVRPRSGLALNNIIVGNAPGTIDSNYRGELKIIVHNRNHYEFASISNYPINKGDRIAQIVLKEQPSIVWEEVNELDETNRGKNGFGSTGI